MSKMDSINIFDTRYGFIELHRTFHELSKDSYENYEADINNLYPVSKRLGWTNLIKEYRVIILSEAGSGKTFEIRNVARTLWEQGKPAFFIRLEHIPRDFEDAFEVGTYEAFGEWLGSGEEGWLFLDSVDEARLRDPGDFELAIRKLSKRLSISKDRSHIIITGRTTAWRPKTDLAHCIAHLPFAVAATSQCDSQTKNDGHNKRPEIETEIKDKAHAVFKIVALDNLTPDQIEVFAKVRGIGDSRAFLDAIERADAWSFTSRPQDLEELTEFWLDMGRIGTRLEIMRNSIDRRLAERDQDRADARPLSVERASQGSRLLAAATTLAQNQTIRVPDGAENSKGIAIKDVLPDWDDKEHSTLLSRPIFDEAIYGLVRFHHRSVREYLTAEWFGELLKRETSRRSIEGLFFSNQYGVDIVVPTLRPILPWLAILDEKIRDRIRKVAPEIIFEGGDPSQLPLETRRYILREVCEQMADGTPGHSIRDYAAVQRFANPDLTEDIRALLIQYKDNDDLMAFLLRMVWIGRLTGALPEAMDVALKPTAERYTRIAAFRAIKATGSKEDREHVRQRFLAESSELNQDWLTELIEDVQPTEQTLVWLLSCLEKSKPVDPYTTDHIKVKVTEFVDSAGIELLPRIVAGFNRLLSTSPMIERRYCKVSEKFKWLITPACKAVKRLILERHPASLKIEALEILHKFSALRDYEGIELNEVKDEFSKCIPAWQELNRALFWYEVHRTRETIDKKRGERLTNYWRASIFGAFWRFEEIDFQYACEEIVRRELLDDKLVALSLAFDLYKLANRPRSWRTLLKKLVSDNDELSESLSTYFRPPAQSKDYRRWKQQEAKWKRQAEIRNKKKEKYQADWKKYLTDNFDKIHATLRKNPGTITNCLLYLFDKTHDRKSMSGRWTEYNWKTLIPGYGEKVARLYRDSAVSLWRHHEPKLRSEGAPFNKTPYTVIIGLVGLEIEVHETKGWPSNLSPTEVERACRYVSYELNGFPTWFPKLFETHPKIVHDFLMQEVRYELSIEKPETETHYILNDLSWSGQWAWDHISPSIYDLLTNTEPQNLANLGKLLKIIQGSNMPDNLIEYLASRKCRTLRKQDHVACWFAVWTGVAPDIAIAALKKRIRKISDPTNQTMFAMTYVTHLL